MKSINQFLASLVKSNYPARPLSVLTNGLIAGLLEIVVVVSFCALVFSAGLSSFVGPGIGLALLATAINLILVALLTSLPGTIGGSQDLPVIIIAGVAASIAQGLADSAQPQEIFLTVVAAVGITTAATGACLLALGHFRIGQLVRFLPYPVMGGMLAGTGWLLTIGAISTMADEPLGLPFFQEDSLLRWLPGLFFGVALLWAHERQSNRMLIPGMVLGGVSLFYVVMLLAEKTTAELLAQGWLLGPFGDDGLFREWAWGDVKQVHWASILQEAFSLATIPVLSAVALLLNSAALEVAVERDVDMNRELKVAGIANLFTGAAGGFAGFQEVGISVMNHQVGATSRLTGVIAALVCGVALFEGAALLSLFPKVVSGGLLLFLGLSLLFEWVWKSWSKLPLADYAVVMTILLSTALFGFLEAVAVGLALAMILFVVYYSRIDVLRRVLSGSTYLSRVVRSSSQRASLRETGDAICVLQLQGYLFFGSASRLLTRVRSRLDDAKYPSLRFVLLDFHHVTGVDITITIMFNKLRQLMQPLQIKLVVTGASTTVAAQLKRADLQEDESCRLFADLDRGLEWCEEQLLQKETTLFTLQDRELPLHEALAEVMPCQDLVVRLTPYLERQDLTAGQRLICQGEKPECLYFMVGGQITAQRTFGDAPEREPVRLSTQRGTQVVGEIGFYLGHPRSADVIADESSVVYSLSAEDLRRMEIQDPQLASELHRLIVRLLASRVMHLTEAVGVLQN